MSNSIWEVMAEDRSRGKSDAAPPTKFRLAYHAGPNRTRLLELATYRAAEHIRDGLSPARAANRALHEWELKFRESGQIADEVVRVTTNANAIARARERAAKLARKKRPQPREEIDFRWDAPPVRMPDPPDRLIRRRQIEAWVRSQQTRV